MKKYYKVESAWNDKEQFIDLSMVLRMRRGNKFATWQDAAQALASVNHGKMPDHFEIVLVEE